MHSVMGFVLFVRGNLLRHGQLARQGFNWESCKQGWWELMVGQADFIASCGFTAVWLPPPTDSVSREGYMCVRAAGLALPCSWVTLQRLSTLLQRATYQDAGVPIWFTFYLAVNRSQHAGTPPHSRCRLGRGICTTSTARTAARTRCGGA